MSEGFVGITTRMRQHKANISGYSCAFRLLRAVCTVSPRKAFRGVGFFEAWHGISTMI